MKAGSLRLRLIAGGGVALILALVIAGIGLTFLFERQVLRQLADDLEVDLRQVLGAIELDPAGQPLLARDPTDPRFAEPLSGLYWQAGSEETGYARSRSLWDTSIPLPPDELAPGEKHMHRLAGPANAELLALERTVLLKHSDRDIPVRVVIAADLARVAAARRSFVSELVPALALLGGVLAAAMWTQIGLGLRPLERIRNGIAAVSTRRARRLEGEVPSEVAPLVAEINNLLADQEVEIERSRNRAADLAHGLKTPLAALSADARELAEKGEDEIAARIADVGEAMRRHVDRELARARIRGARTLGASPSERLRPLVASLVAIVGRTDAGSRIAFDIDIGDESAIAMDKADLAEVLGNLIENAAGQARTRVRISSSQDGSVTVEDDGPGIPTAMREAVRQRGKRLDESAGGAGLGLSIVDEVLEAYGRKLRLGVSPLGGLAAVF